MTQIFFEYVCYGEQVKLTIANVSRGAGGLRDGTLVNKQALYSQLHEVVLVLSVNGANCLNDQTATVSNINTDIFGLFVTDSWITNKQLERKDKNVSIEPTVRKSFNNATYLHRLTNTNGHVGTCVIAHMYQMNACMCLVCL